MRIKRKNGQALVEAVIVLPILIIMLWGVYRTHAVSFLGARAEMAARHAAWTASVCENEGDSILDSTFNAEKGIAAANDMLFDNESGMQDSVATAEITVEPKGMWVVKGLEDAEDDGEFNFLDVINLGDIGIDMISDILSTLPIFRPFTRNAWAVIDLEIDSFGADNDKISAYAYFGNRWESLYFKSIWDLLNVSFGEAVSGITDAISDADDAINQAQEDLEDGLDETDGEFPDGTPYTYDDFKEYLEKWKQFFSNW